MVPSDQLNIHPNPSNGCYEAWLVDPHTQEKRLVSTCSLCVSDDQFHWWNRQVCNILHDALSLPTAA